MERNGPAFAATDPTTGAHRPSIVFRRLPRHRPQHTRYIGAVKLPALRPQFRRLNRP